MCTCVYVCMCVCVYVCACVLSLTHLTSHSGACLQRVRPHPLTYPPSHILTHPPSHPLTYTPSHILTHSPISPLTPSPPIRCIPTTGASTSSVWITLNVNCTIECRILCTYITTEIYMYYKMDNTVTSRQNFRGAGVGGERIFWIGIVDRRNLTKIL